MIAGSQWRPNGVRLTYAPSIKIKGLQIQRWADEPTTADMYKNWHWADRLQPQINLAVQNEHANCLKFCNSILALNDGLSQATHDAQMVQFLNYAASLGVYVYWCFHYFQEAGSLASNPQDLAKVVAAARIVAQYPNVIGADISNEVFFEAASAGFTNTQATASCVAGLQAVRAACPKLPLCVSFLVQGVSGWTQSNLNGVYTLCDFLDFHPYYSSGDPVAADLATYRASGFYKPFLIGECGQTFGSGQTAQTSRWTALGTLSGQSDCFGVVGYTTQDVDSSDYAMYTQPNPPTRRAWIANAFDAWPAHA